MKLEELLAEVGSPLDADGVFETFQEAQAEGAEPAEVFPVLFDAEPRFSSPDVARRFYANLFGLWDLVKQGGALPAQRVKAPKAVKERPPAPTPFGAQVPTREFVEAAARFLHADERLQLRLNDAFENRQDALLTALDAAGLSDEGYVAARHALFELFAILELGLASMPGLLGKAMVGSVDGDVLETSQPLAPGQLPEALRAFVEQAVAETDLPGSALAEVQRLALQGAAGLWAAAKR